MLKVAYYESQLRRSRIIGDACIRGLKRAGINPIRRTDRSFRHHGVEADVALHYGLKDFIPEIRGAYIVAGKKSVLLDLGYWGRRLRDRYDGYHRFAVNALHAQARGPMPFDRIERFRVKRRDMHRIGTHILLCGQSEKAAEKYGMIAEEWERNAVRELKQHTDRPIWYMPKGSWPDKRPLAGTRYRDQPLEPMLADAWAVVSHHSNSGIHALAMGVPIYTVDGAARPFSMKSLADIENPRRFTFAEISQFLADVAYLQWSVDEIASGRFWKHLQEDWL